MVLWCSLPVFSFHVRGCYPLWRPFPRLFCLDTSMACDCPKPQSGKPLWFRLFPVRSPLLGKSSFLSFPPGTKMFQFPGFPSENYGFIFGYIDMTLCEFPHSEIFGSKVACTSPKLIAAYRVLHRLPAPRHSPYALCFLILFFLRLAASAEPAFFCSSVSNSRTLFDVFSMVFSD